MIYHTFYRQTFSSLINLSRNPASPFSFGFLIPLTFHVIIHQFQILINQFEAQFLMDQKFIFLLVALLIFFGAVNTIQLKLQSIHVVNRITGEKFFHPLIQTILLFIGESFVGFIYLYHLRREKKHLESQSNQALIAETDKTVKQEIQVQKPEAPFIKALWPAVFDMFGTLFAYIALNTVDAVVWQMSKGGTIVSVAILSRVILKRIFKKQAILGCIVAFLGITGVQTVSVLTSDHTSVSLREQLIGIALLFISIFFSSFGLIIEKQVFDKYEIHPLKLVHYEGIFGVIIMSLLTFGLQFIPCPWANKNQCVCIAENDCYLENYNKYFTDLASSYMLILLTIGFIISISISVPIGAYLSKTVSPISRSLANVSRTVLIWVFNITMTATIGQTKSEYKLENLDILVNILYGICFCTLLAGIYLYHYKKKEEKPSNQVQSQNQAKQTTEIMQ